MKPIYFLTFILIHFNILLTAQNACDEPLVSSSCDICEEVMTLNNAGFTQGFPGPGFQCGAVDNNFFLTFYPSKPYVRFDLLATNCQNNNGIQAQFYNSKYEPIGECYSGTNIIDPDAFIDIDGLTVAEPYFLMIDGFAGDICDIQITATNIILKDSLPIIKVDSIRSSYQGTPICPGTTICFETDSIPNALGYFWFSNVPFDFVSGKSTHKPCIRFSRGGNPGIWVQPYKPCYQVSRSATLYTPVLNRPITDIGTIRYCINEFPVEYNGRIFPEPGFYYDTLAAVNSCDSLLRLTVESLPPLRKALNFDICDGGEVNVFGQTYTEPGDYQYFWDNPQGQDCDTIFHINITKVEPYTEIIEETICSNETFEFRGQVFREAGNYQVNIKVPGGGCDSIFEINLTVIPAPLTIVDTVVSRNSIFQNVLIKNDTTFSIIFQTNNNCDSSVVYIISTRTTETSNIHYSEKEISVFPNPARNHLFISNFPENNPPVKLQFFNNDGLQMKSVNFGIDLSKKTSFFNIDIQELPVGIYLLKIEFKDGELVVKRLVKS